MAAQPELNLVDMIDCHARHAGSQPAFIMNDETINWSDFSKQVNRVANALIRAGLEKGDKVSFMALNSIKAVTVLFGTMRAGGVVVPLSAMLTPDLICSLLQDSGAKFFFVDQNLSPLQITSVMALKKQLYGRKSALVLKRRAGCLLNHS